ncbi:Pycsar system effector family protein [Mesorhizobium sp. WSM2239]|uniref:Pycsar system effector family protein n=2 Tax=unclassified Mesorhizobium TaxID=325217 RepID=A0AAU8D8T3_9HYPH
MAAMEKTKSAISGADVQALPMGKDYVEHLKKINDVFYDQIKIADQKAAYIFTFMLAFLITSSEGRASFKWQRYVDAEFPLVIFSGGMALAASCALVAAILVVLPRRGVGSTSLFWGGWAAHRAEVIEAGSRNDPDFIFREYLANIDSLSLIARVKYRYVTIAFRSLIFMVLAYLLLLLAVS